VSSSSSDDCLSVDSAKIYEDTISKVKFRAFLSIVLNTMLLAGGLFLLELAGLREGKYLEDNPPTTKDTKSLTWVDFMFLFSIAAFFSTVVSCFV